MTTVPGWPDKAGNPAGRPRLQRALDFLHRVEDLLIAILLMATMGLALYQIALRNLMDTGLVWGDVMVRIMVLWLGMAGAMAATREKKHISIDLLTRFLAPAPRRVAVSLTTLFAGVVCALASYFSLQFVRSEYAAGDLAFGRVPFWVCEAILPIAFAVIALRYGLQFCVHLAATFRRAD
ncbi:MAG: TRAP transporter small permease subunit [Desulfobacterales bacterium]|nr:TRAP transporter small permease subunit [Desulfobacterales bacterium]